MSEPSAIKILLADEAKVGSEVTVQGWIRSKRDSKAGISFLAINDGSHFDSLQCVVANTLSNYESEVLKGVAFFGDRVGLWIVYITDNGDSRRLNLDRLPLTL